MFTKNFCLDALPLPTNVVNYRIDLLCGGMNMALHFKKKSRWNYIGLAFLIPVFSILMVMLFGRYEPFGNNRSMLYSDMYHQYYPFFVNFREALRSGSGLLYNWNIGMGLDYLGLISYYLASPLNLLTVLLPESWMLEYFSLLMPLKLGFASMFFALFLKKIFRREDFSLCVFGALYGLCAWALGYQWNIMWLDTFALLPLVALGTIALLRDKKFFLYTFTLFLSIFSNYYIGLFTCIFVLLLFIVYQICRCRSIKRFIGDLFRIALFSILAIGMTAILELPALAALQTTQSSVNNFPQSFRLNIADEHTWKGLLDAMRQVAGNMGGGLEPSFKEGLPNLYCGVGTIVLAFLFLSTRKVKLRDKFCSVLLLLFFMVSFIIRQLDYIWHGFHFTNMIPYRFSFLFSFVLLYMAYRAYLLRDVFQAWQIVLAGILSLGIFACAIDTCDAVYLAFNLVFLALYLGVLLFPKFQAELPEEPTEEQVEEHKKTEVFNRKIASIALLAIMGLEIGFNVINFGIQFPYTGVSNYPKGTEDSMNVISYMKENEDDLFYRAEVTHAQTLNDGALNGYYGISTFTSSANVKVTEFMKDLAFGAKNTYNRYCYEESSPIANLFLGIKYMIERDGNVESNAYFDTVYKSGNVYLQESNAYLPLGFLTNTSFASFDFSGASDAFSFQSKLLKKASGITGDAWHKVNGNALSITAEDVTLTTSGRSGYASYESGDKAGSVTFNFTADREGFACINLTNLSKKNGYSISLNGEKLYSETYSLPQMLSISDVVPGDVISVEFSCKANEKGTISSIVAILDEQIFREAYEILSASTLELTTFTSTFVEGTIDCDRDGFLYTSIPQNGNWTAQVDGKDAQIMLVNEAMIGIPLTEGNHKVSFRYDNPAFSLGWKISLVCAVLFGLITIICYIPKRKKGKFER